MNEKRPWTKVLPNYFQLTTFLTRLFWPNRSKAKNTVKKNVCYATEINKVKKKYMRCREPFSVLEKDPV